jgi:hypothetical protein
VKCAYCQREFEAGQARQSCKGCLAAGGCRKVQCPYCGYEMPMEPRWIQRILRRRRKP